MPEARPSNRRPFTLADALALIGATAMGLAPIRAYLAGAKETDLWRAIDAISLMLASWTLWFLVLHLIPPRPRLRRVARQPGFAACFASSAWGAVYELGLVIQLARVQLLPQEKLELFAGSLPRVIAGAVAASWLTLALTGCGRPEPTWCDRLGRALGAGWLVLFLLRCLAFYLGY